MTFATAIIEENLSRLESKCDTHSNGRILKELVFNRVRVLKSEGYAEDVAFSIALREHNVI